MHFKIYLEMNMTFAAKWLSVGITKADSKKNLEDTMKLTKPVLR